jgi:hypothetical protein|tara:strand:+ start:23130 stop:23231 length:102 start_codon:yes stop_codon:yes gene_type:complete
MVKSTTRVLLKAFGGFCKKDFSVNEIFKEEIYD